MSATVFRGVILGDPCAYCKAPSEVVDHITPRADGGTNFWDNLTGACAGCNGRKGQRSLLSFLGYKRTWIPEELEGLEAERRDWMMLGRPQI